MYVCVCVCVYIYIYMYIYIYLINWQNSRRFWTISSLHALIFVPKHQNILIIYISNKKNQYIFVYGYWRIFVWRWWDILNYIKSSCVKMSRYLHYIFFTRKVNTFSSKCMDEFWSRGTGTFCDWQVLQKKKYPKKIYKNFWTLSSLHAWFSVLICPGILQLYIAYKKNKQVLGSKLFELIQVFV